MSAGSLDPVVQPKTLTEQVAASIRAAIVAGTLPAGARITAPSLARQLQVSQTPVREALRNLQEVGLVSFDTGALVVVGPNEQRIRDAYETREAVEGQAARLAAQRRTDEQAHAITALAERTIVAAQRHDERSFFETDESFHRAIAVASCNDQLARLVANARDVATVLTRLRSRGLAFRADAAGMHAAIADAIAVREPDAAEIAMRTHIRSVLEQTLEAKGVGADGVLASTTDAA